MAKNQNRRSVEEVGLHQVPSVPGEGQTTVQSILQGSCVVCANALESHFKDGRWIGCQGKRRAGDALFVPPMTILLTPGSGAIIPETFTRSLTFTPVSEAADMGYIRRAADAATEVVQQTGRRARQTFKTIRKSAKRAAGRGRQAFLYFVKGREPKDITEGDSKVFREVAKHKSGMLFKDIVARTKLPASTADWARIRLMKAGALVRKPAPTGA